MKLHVLDRLALLSLLPQEGDFTTLKMVRSLRERLSDYSEDERKALAFTSQTLEGQPFTQWDSNADTGWEFEFAPSETSLIVECLKRADSQKKLREAHMNVFEAFMGTSQ
jgi:hypothetical protein